MAIDYNDINSVIGGFDKILKLSSVGGPPPVPAPLIIIGVPRRSGLSPLRVASRIIARKSEAGLPVGVLPSGAVSADEIMWRVAVEEIFKELQQNAIISVAIPPGISVTAAGISPTGPVSVFGATIMISRAYGIIQ